MEIETGSLIKRYVDRPDSLENISLADWAAWYDGENKMGQNINRKFMKGDSDGLLLETQDEDNFEDDLENCEIDCNKLGKSTMKKHAKCRIIRSMWFNKEKNAEKYYRELLFLFTPWRDENGDIDSFHPFDQRCQELRRQINLQLAQYCPYSSQIEQARFEMREPDDDDNEMWDSIAPNTQHTELSDGSGTTMMNTSNHGDQLNDSLQNYDLSDDLGIPSSLIVDNDTSCNEMCDDEYREIVRSLNDEQLIFFYHIVHQLKTSDAPF